MNRMIFYPSLSCHLRRVVGLVMLCCFVLAPALAGAAPDPLRAQVRVEDAKNHRSLSLGAVEVNALPSEVRAAVLDFHQWPRLFSDVKWVKVKSRNTTEAIVEVKSRSLGPANKLRVRLDDPSGTRFETVKGRGVHLRGEFLFQPVNQTKTRIQGTLHTNVTGVLGWVVTERSVRKERQNKLRSYLGDIYAWFGKR